MQKTKIGKRMKLIEAAGKLFHTQGINQTTLADIARESGVPLGNVYYYFKTKEEITHAMIEHRMDCYQSQFREWETLPDPKARILACIQGVVDQRDVLAQNGCPMGSLCQELDKDDGPLADKAASMFAALLVWLESQFGLLGSGKAAADNALHLVAVLQGVSLLTNAFKDPELMLRETRRLMLWVNEM